MPKSIRAITEDEMVAVFLKGELGSSRFRAQLGSVLARLKIDRDVIACPDLDHLEQNEARAAVLGEMHGYRRDKKLLRLFPENVRWERVLIGRDELRRIQYCDYSYWNELSGGSRMPSDGARAYERGTIVFHQPHVHFWQLVDALRGGATFPELILVTHDREKLVVVEGHLRLTAMMLSFEHVPEELEVILGDSPETTNWPLY